MVQEDSNWERTKSSALCRPKGAVWAKGMSMELYRTLVSFQSLQMSFYSVAHLIKLRFQLKDSKRYLGMYNLVILFDGSSYGVYHRIFVNSGMLKELVPYFWVLKLLKHCKQIHVTWLVRVRLKSKPGRSWVFKTLPLLVPKIELLLNQFRWDQQADRVITSIHTLKKFHPTHA